MKKIVVDLNITNTLTNDVNNNRKKSNDIYEQVTHKGVLKKDIYGKNISDLNMTKNKEDLEKTQYIFFI